MIGLGLSRIDFVDWKVNCIVGFLDGVLSEKEYDEFKNWFDEKDFHPVWNCSDECCPDARCECGDCDACRGIEYEEEEVGEI